MKSNFDKSLKDLLSPDREGGFSNHPDDPGGMTNHGVTKTVWEAWVGHPVDEKTMRNLTVEMVAPMYKRKYWDKINGDNLPAGIDYCCFDAAVNSGAGRSVKWLQGVIGVDVDGAIGPKTMKALNEFDAKQFIQDYSKRRLSFLTDLPTWGTFGKGWSRRISEVEKTALTMI